MCISVRNNRGEEKLNLNVRLKQNTPGNPISTSYCQLVVDILIVIFVKSDFTNAKRYFLNLMRKI